jgi:orotidine-5'-phosphate decarboxylase
MQEGKQVKHAHVYLAEAQRVQKTLLCPGPCPHPFMGRKENYAVYGRVTSGEVYDYYEALLALTNMKNPEERKVKAGIMAAAEIYTKEMLRIWIEVCGLRTFKDQDGVYQRWGPAGDFMMMRVVEYVRELEKKLNTRVIYQHDCKRGDLGATMMGYYDRFIGDLQEMFEIDHAYYTFDTMNIQIYMGDDVAMLKEVKKKNIVPAHGLRLMRDKGKGIVVVCKSSNDSGPDYQQLFIPARGKTLEECVAEDVHAWTVQYGLIYDELSPLGLVVGSTHEATGIIRRLAPYLTLWVPGFGNQIGKYENIMLELIRFGKWNGQGAIFTNETAAMYAHLKKFGGTDKFSDAEKFALAMVEKSKRDEYAAYQAPEVKAAGIRYPF